MTTRDQFLALAARCEAATGPDREVDEAIREATGYPEKPWNYTGSIDAITALIERELPGWGFGSVVHDPADKMAVAHVGHDDHNTYGTSATTEALARCAAFLRAKAEGAP